MHRVYTVIAAKPLGPTPCSGSPSRGPRVRSGRRCPVAPRAATGGRGFGALARILSSVAGLALLIAAAAPAAACPDEFPLEGRIAGVDERLEVTLADGRLINIAGLEPPRATPAAPDRPAATRAWVSQWLVGLPIALRPLSVEPDRWGRLPVRARVEGPEAEPDSAPVDLAAALLARGLARFRPAAALGDCRIALLAAEGAARAQDLGLWADPVYAVLRDAGKAAFLDRTGETVVVEGRVTRVGEARFRSYLNFGPIRGQDFAVTILKRNQATFDKAGLPLRALGGKWIRVRGPLETRFGPQIEIASPEELEIIDAPGAASANRGQQPAR
jgi:hypothetical protein